MAVLTCVLFLLPFLPSRRSRGADSGLCAPETRCIEFYLPLGVLVGCNSKARWYSVAFDLAIRARHASHSLTSNTPCTQGTRSPPVTYYVISVLRHRNPA